jgi:hypothetical protein
MQSFDLLVILVPWCSFFPFKPDDNLKSMDDLTSGIVNFQQAALMSKVQFAVARKMLDSQQVQGAAVIKLIEAAGRGANQAGDQLVAAATGLGGQIDICA